MNRRQFSQKLWRDCRGLLASGAPVAIAGGGLSGLHLAYSLLRRECRVTLFEPLAVGGVRIPLMHACQASKERPQLWESAASYGRGWYNSLIARGYPIASSSSEHGEYFTIHARAYLRRLRHQMKGQGLVSVRKPFAVTDADNFSICFTATGADLTGGTFPWLETVAQKLGGFESYASGNGGDSTLHEGTILDLPARHGFIHRRVATAGSARDEAANIFVAQRKALFHGQRLVTRDRLPVVGFSPTPDHIDYTAFREKIKGLNFAQESMSHKSPFLFQGMGYHAMTYAPFLAEMVAAWLTGEATADENSICTLTPARFLPR